VLFRRELLRARDGADRERAEGVRLLPAALLEVLIDKLGYSEYLKERIREELKKTATP